MVSFDSFATSVEGTDVVRVLTGFRGVGKTTRLRGLLADAEKASPGVRTVYVEVEQAVFRSMRTLEAMFAYVMEQAGPSRFRLVLDEPSHFHDLVPLIRQVGRTGRCEAVYVVCSNSWRLDELERNFKLLRCHLSEPPETQFRPEQEELMFHKMILRDVLCPNHCMDASGPWHIGCWLAEHLGERTSLRKLAAEISRYGSRLSHPTADTYLLALQNAFLIERVSCWDLFDNARSRNGFKLAVVNARAFYHAFAVDVDACRKAVDWNSAYLALRRTHDVVYFPNCIHADFVTLDAQHRPVPWLVKDGVPVRRDP